MTITNNWSYVKRAMGGFMRLFSTRSAATTESKCLSLVRRLTVTLLGLIACGVSQTSIALMAGQGLMWSVSSKEPVVLSVCWLNPEAADPLVNEVTRTNSAQRREWVRLALKGSWERHARIVFTGWGRCKNEGAAAKPLHTLGPRRPGAADENIKVKITTSGGSQNPAHGSWGDYQSPSVTLNLHGNLTENIAALRKDIEYLAIHEFGHVLGFYHEEERHDWPTNITGCPPQKYPPSDPWWPVPTELDYGSPDKDSVMAYCSGRPNKLSLHDIAAVQTAYGRHIPGSLVSQAGGLCLAAHAAKGNGDRAFGWECDEALDDQEWRFVPSTSALYIRSDGPSPKRRCLDVDTGTGTKVQIWECNGQANQRWQFDNVQVQGYGGLCVTGHPTTKDLVMQSCDLVNPRQRWRIEHSGSGKRVRLRSMEGNLCITASGTDMTPARLVPCNDGAAQQLFLGSGGLLQLASNVNRCLDVRNVRNVDYLAGKGGPASNQVVQVFRCLGNQLNQRFYLSGDVRSGGTRCLTRSGDGMYNGVSAVMAKCNGSSSQQWDYNW